MAGGPTVNLLIAFFIFAARLRDATATPATCGSAAGRRHGRRPAWSRPPRTGRVCTRRRPGQPGAPRPASRPGDRIVAFNGTRITDWTQLQHLIRGNDDGRAAIIVVERDGEQLTLTTNTTVTPRPDLGDRPRRSTQVGFLGVAPTSRARPPAARSTRSSRWAR